MHLTRQYIIINTNIIALNTLIIADIRRKKYLLSLCFGLLNKGGVISKQKTVFIELTN